MRVAINGLGRIGRAVFKLLVATPDLEVAAVNDLTPPDNLAYLLNHDTVYGRYANRVTVCEQSLAVGDQSYPVYAEPDPLRLPWRRLDIDLVFECTGRFNSKAELSKHLDAGAKRVMLSAPAKDDDIPTVVFGVNAYDEKDGPILSCASCTTNCITPVMEILGRRIGVKKAIMTTVHAYTASQAIVDAPRRHVRRGRAGASNLVPTSTGAAAATARALPEYGDRFDGVAVRVPVAVGSLADIVALAARPTTVHEVNRVFTEEAESARYRGVLGVTTDPIVSSDIIRDTRASVVDLGMSQVVDGDLVKVMSWYDNEWGYSSQLVREAMRIAREMDRKGA